MTLLVTDPDLRDQLIAERQASGGDRYDEVWDGVYVMSPLANFEHQRLITALASAIQIVIGEPGLGVVLAGVNVSDREQGWEHNYRVPDVAVLLKGGRAKVLEAHVRGGPDFVVEVISRGDRSREKLSFYEAIATGEVLLVDRDPWALELYGLRGGKLVPLGVSRPERPEPIASAVLPLTFRLVPGDATRIEVVAVATGQAWLV